MCLEPPITSPENNVSEPPFSPHDIKLDEGLIGMIGLDGLGTLLGDRSRASHHGHEGQENI